MSKNASRGKRYIEKSTNKLKIIFIILLIFSIIAGVFYFYNNKKVLDEKDINSVASINEEDLKIEKEIKKTINNTFEALVKINKDKVNETLDYKKLISCFDDSIIENNKEIKLEKALLQSLKWEIKDVDLKNNQISANIKFTNKDFKKILTDWLSTLDSEKLKGTEIAEKIALEKLKELTEKETLTKEKDSIINLEKKDNKYTFVVDDNLVYSIFPGIDVIETALID